MFLALAFPGRRDVEFCLADRVRDGAGLRRALPLAQVHNRHLWLVQFRPLTFSCLSPSRGHPSTTGLGAASFVRPRSLGRLASSAREWSWHAAWVGGALQPRCHEGRVLWDGLQNDIG